MRILLILFIILNFNNLYSQNGNPIPGEEQPEFPADSIIIFKSPRPLIDSSAINQDYKNAAGFKVGFSSYGFALGGFYQRKLNDKMSFNAFLFFSQVTEGSELVQFDPFTGRQYIPFKLNRVWMMPTMVGLRYQLFKEKIVNTFLPFVGAGGGISLVMVAPYSTSRIFDQQFGLPLDMEGNPIDNVGFFNSLGQADFQIKPGAYVEFGAEFTSGLKLISSLTFRYYFIPYGGDGVESIIDRPITTLGQFFISLNLGRRF